MFLKTWFHDYTVSALALWMTAFVLGMFAICDSISRLSGINIGQTLLILILVAVASSFPIKIPNSKHAISVSDLLIFLSLIKLGAPIAVLAAAIDGFISSFRSSNRPSSWIGSATSLSLSMFVAGHAFTALIGDAHKVQLAMEGWYLLFSLLISSLLYSLLHTWLIVQIISLKKDRLTSWRGVIDIAGFAVISIASLALAAGVLFIAEIRFDKTPVLTIAAVLFSSLLLISASQND